MKTTMISFLMVGLLVLTGCQQGGPFSNWGTKQTVGAGAGAVAGGLAGSAIGSGSGRDWAIGAGVLLGALLGSEVGKSLDKADMAYAQQAQNQAYSAPIGQTINWSNPESGNSGSYTAVREGQTQSGDYCREYQQTIVVDGQAETAYGTACRNPDGSWQLVN